MGSKDEKLFVRLSAELRERIQAEAKARDESESVIVREALREYFERKSEALAAVLVKNVMAAGGLNKTERAALNEPATSYKIKRK